MTNTELEQLEEKEIAEIQDFIEFMNSID